MIGRGERRLLQGPAGPIEVVLDWPAAAAVDDALRRAGTRRPHAADPARAAAQAAIGVAVVGHPHPLYGGTLDNKVAATLARTFSGLGWLAVRFNFRGVGASGGTHDHGDGETDDFAWLTDAMRDDAAVRAALAAAGLPDGAATPTACAGFSFGTFVAARAAARQATQGHAPRHLVLVGAAAGKWAMPPVPADTLVIHGERDDTIPLADVLQWAAPLDVAVVVIPQADHFFHRRLALLKAIVMRNLLGSEAHRRAHGRAADGSGVVPPADGH